MLKKRPIVVIMIMLVALVASVPLLPGVALAARNAPPTFAGLASVTCNTTSNVYRLSWSAATDDRTPQNKIKYNVFTSTAPTLWKYDFSTPVVSIVGTTFVDVTGLNPLQRYFFIVRAVDGSGLGDWNIKQQATRSLGLANATNFRDLGGYYNEWGLRVKWGKIYRTNNLAGLTASENTTVLNLGFNRVIDLRMGFDIIRDRGYDQPYYGNQAKYDYVPFDYGNNMMNALPPPPFPVADPPATAWTESQVRELEMWSLGWDLTKVDMDNLYINILEGNRAGIKQVFDCLADPSQGPIIFHCTQGKDRAGVVAALILMTLHVPNETIMQDYQLTHELTLADINGKMQSLTGAAMYYPFLFPPAMLTPSWFATGYPLWLKLVDTYPPMMQNLLNYIEAQYGGIEGYLRSIGVRPIQQAKIMALNLEYVR